MIVRPPDHPPLSLAEPVVFLAGPIQGAPNWQHAAERLLGDRVHVANPRAEGFGQTHGFDAQVDWESHWLRRAAHRGCVLFWLAAEGVHDPARAYAQTTRFELGEWLTRVQLSATTTRVVVGAEAGFTGTRYVERRLATTFDGVAELPLARNLTELCARALLACGVDPSYRPSAASNQGGE